MDKTALVEFLRARLQGCAGWGPDGIQAARTDALTYYLQRPRGDEITGRSAMVSGDVSASVEANLAQMMAAATNSNVAEFDPTGEEDEDQSQLETDTVVYLTMRKGDGFIQLATAAKDALLQRVGIIKSWCENKRTAQIKTFENVEDEDTLAAVLDAIGEDAELVNWSNNVATVRLMVTKIDFRNAAIAPENFFYGAEDWDFNLQNIDFCAERHVDFRYKLYERFDRQTVDSLTPFSGSSGRPDAAARNPSGFVDTRASTGADKAYDKIEWLECYALVDLDDDGFPERCMIPFVWNDSKVIGDDESGTACSLVPYAMGTTILMPHRLTGLGQYDKLRMVQDENTGMKRARDDNVNAVNKNRTATLDGVVNADDLGDGRVNGNLRVNAELVSDVRQAAMAFPIPDNTGNILANIEAIKRDRTEMGGAALELASGNLQVGGDRMGSQGLDRAYSVMESLAALMMQTFANTLVRNWFLVAHATLREHYTGAVNIKKNGRWFSPIPAEWSERDAITVKLGQSPGERARMASTLRTIIQDHIYLTEKGQEGVLVDVERFYRAYMDWARVSDVPIPEQYYIDPMTPAAQDEMMRKGKAAQAQQQKQENLLAQAVGLRKVEVALPKYVADQEIEYKYWAKVIDAEIEEAQIAGDAVTKLITHNRGSETDETKPAAKGKSKAA